jgi:oxalate decarboxylase/phosphoglucose isomerase-like protein (cupin superfamily)
LPSVECISNYTCEFLEILKAPQFIDVSLSQWLAVSPVQVVADHLRVSNETINAWSKTKTVIVKGDPMVS